MISARYAGEHATDADNNALLLRNLEGIENRTARFVCVIAPGQGRSTRESIPRLGRRANLRRASWVRRLRL
ncbi:MAG: non-canonical purine NTP pyrophosphatase [Acidobacteriota bacterium]